MRRRTRDVSKEEEVVRVTEREDVDANREETTGGSGVPRSQGCEKKVERRGEGSCGKDSGARDCKYVSEAGVVAAFSRRKKKKRNKNTTGRKRDRGDMIEAKNPVTKTGLCRERLKKSLSP